MISCIKDIILWFYHILVIAALPKSYSSIIITTLTHYTRHFLNSIYANKSILCYYLSMIFICLRMKFFRWFRIIYFINPIYARYFKDYNIFTLERSNPAEYVQINLSILISDCYRLNMYIKILLLEFKVMQGKSSLNSLCIDIHKY